MKEDGIPFPHMYLACGLDDPLLSPNRKFRDTMRELGVDVTYEEGPGAHEWDFWNRYIKKVLEWLPLDKDSKRTEQWKCRFIEKEGIYCNRSWIKPQNG